jgi:hypothetical protein
LTGCKATTNEGCATISDKDGNYILMVLTFTTKPSNNGYYGLLGNNPVHNHSAKATNPYVYYIFTVDEPNELNADENL